METQEEELQLGSFFENPEEDEGGAKLLPWRVEVLRAGLEEVARDCQQNNELYLSLPGPYTEWVRVSLSRDGGVAVRS